MCVVESFYRYKVHPREGGIRIDGCRVFAYQTSEPLPLERLANPDLGTLRETRCKKK